VLHLSPSHTHACRLRGRTSRRDHVHEHIRPDPFGPFRVPIVIADGSDVIAWGVDLTYDPTVVQVNDPPLLDFFSYTTEGDFFADGAPFNLLTPGFIALDPFTLLQTGLLFGIEGAYGGLLPLPSGSGVLAYVEFVAIGIGDAAISVADGTVTSVPEPSTLLLLGAGLAGLYARRRRTAAAH
jgi:hypothetical protein